MRQIQLGEIPKLDDGEPIPSVAGRVKVVFARKAGSNDKGDWSFQDFVLSDGDNEVIVKASNLEDLSDLKGQDVVVECNKNEKHGLTGIKKLVDTYQGKTLHKIKLTASCKIRAVDGESHTDPDWPEAPEGTRADYGDGSPDSPVPLPQAPPARPNSEAGVMEARRHLMQSSNAMLLVMEAARYVITEWEKRHSTVVGEDHFQALCATLFINLDKAGYIQKLPSKPI